MPIDPLVMELLDDVDSGKTPEEACEAHPGLLEEVRARLGQRERVCGEIDALFPEGTSSLVGRPPTPPPASTPEIPGHAVESVLGRGGMSG